MIFPAQCVQCPKWSSAPLHNEGAGFSRIGSENTLTLTITLPDHIQSYIDEPVAAGRFENDEAVNVDVFEQVITEYRWEEDEDLLEVIAAVDRGEVYEWTPELRTQIRHQSEENARQGHKVSDDITY